MYIAPGQWQKTPRVNILMSTETSCHNFWSFATCLKKISLKSDFIQFFFNDFIHVQGSPFIMPCLRSIGLDRVITEPYYKGIILKRN